jgi:osmotically-inducible protein OsmY
MTRSLDGLSIAGAVLLLAALPACQRASGERARSSDNPVREDVKDVVRSTEKAAKDVGHVVGAGSQDTWITTKVKSELGSNGFDPLRVHVDTDGKVVTLSGTVETAAERDRAVALARAVKDVVSVTDHLFVGPARR